MLKFNCPNCNNRIFTHTYMDLETCTKCFRNYALKEDGSIYDDKSKNMNMLLIYAKFRLLGAELK